MYVARFMKHVMTRCAFHQTCDDTLRVSWHRGPFNIEIDPNAEEAEFKVSNAMKLAFNNKTDDSSFWLSLHDLYPLLRKKAS